MGADVLQTIAHGDHAPGERHLVSLPMGHMGGLTFSFVPFARGVALVLMDRWSPPAARELIDRYAVTDTAGAPVHLSSLLALTGPAVSASIRKFVLGGTSVPADLIVEAARRGLCAVKCYGATEHPSVALGHTADSLEIRATTDGRLMPGIEVRATRDGPVEIEHALRGVPGVADLAVVPVPDPDLGERIGVAVVGPRSVTLEQLRAAVLAAGLARHKQPEYLIHVPDLPRTAAGKVRRADLTDLFRACPRS
jgi:acyl-coenzyme A synthetase/AMP-(fatty) acid ligase